MLRAHRFDLVVTVSNFNTKGSAFICSNPSAMQSYLGNACRVLCDQFVVSLCLTGILFMICVSKFPMFVNRGSTMSQAYPREIIT